MIKTPGIGIRQQKYGTRELKYDSDYKLFVKEEKSPKEAKSELEIKGTKKYW